VEVPSEPSVQNALVLNGWMWLARVSEVYIARGASFNDSSAGLGRLAFHETMHNLLKMAITYTPLVLPRDGIPVAGGLFLLRRRARARAAHCQRQKRDGTDQIECGEYMFHGCSFFWLVVWSGFDFTTLVIRN
jgi:hypothetical protein